MFYNKKQKYNGNKSIRNKDKIVKRLSILGVASRRDAKKLVTDGKVKVNNVVCLEPFFLVSYDDKISVNGKDIVNKPIRTEIYMMNKPSGYITTNNDPQGRRTIFELIPNKFGRLITVGRLDFNTEGLLLLTNNGELARIMEMPATSLKRVYYACVVGKINEETKKKLENLKNGIKIDGVEYGKMLVEINNFSETKAKLRIVIFEGKNNEIRRIMWHLGLKVIKLSRVQYGDFRLQGLPLGCVQKCRQRVDMFALEEIARKNIKKYNLNKLKYKKENDLNNKNENSNI